MLSRDEQRAVRAMGPLRAFAHPDSYEPPTGGSSSTRGLFPEGCWLDYNAKGITITHGIAGHVIVKVTWPKVYAHARSLAPGLLARIITNDQRAQRLAMQDYRLGTLGPGYRYMRDAADKDRPDFDHETWEALRDAIDPMRQRAYWLIHDDRNRLLDEALPLAVDDEPADLLELLAAESLGAAT